MEKTAQTKPKGWCEMPTIAVNGLGRIGRTALKILLKADGIDVVAVNEIVDLDNLAYLLRYDTVSGRYHRKVGTDESALVVDGMRMATLAERDPANLPRADLGVDLVLECTGVFKNHQALTKHHRPAQVLIAESASAVVAIVRVPSPGDNGIPTSARAPAGDADHRSGGRGRQ